MGKHLLSRLSLIMALGAALVFTAGCGGYHHYRSYDHGRYYHRYDGYRYR